MSPTPQQVSWSWGKYRQRLHNLKTVALVLGVCKHLDTTFVIKDVKKKQFLGEVLVSVELHVILSDVPVSAVYP